MCALCVIRANLAPCGLVEKTRKKTRKLINIIEINVSKTNGSSTVLQKTCQFSNKMFLVRANCIFAVPKKHKSEKNKIKWPPTTTIFLFFIDLFHKLHPPHHFCNLPQNPNKLQTTLEHNTGGGQVFAFALNSVLNQQNTIHKQNKSCHQQPRSLTPEVWSGHCTHMFNCLLVCFLLV